MSAMQTMATTATTATTATVRVTAVVSCLLALACGGSGSPPPPPPSTTAAAKAITADSVKPTADLSKLRSNIPKAVTDTFAFRPLRVEQIPDAPLALIDAAEREQGISRFCYQEFGQKVDPKLIGAVALVVTIERNAIAGVRVGADDWSGPAGRAVDRCLTQKAPQAWKLLPDARVPDGKYVVQLQFRPT